jgi:predicted transcriptional regulator
MLSIPNLAIPINTTLENAFLNYFILYKKSFFPVNQGYQVVGIIHIEDIKKVPQYQRSEIIVGDIMKNISEFPSIDQKQSGKAALKKLNKISEGPLLLIVRDDENNNFIGFLGKNELLTSLEFWSSHMPNMELK